MSETNLPWPGYRLREGWRVVEQGELLTANDAFPNYVDEGHPRDWRRTGGAGSMAGSDIEYFRRTDPNAALPPVEPIPAEPVKDEPVDDVRRALEVVSDTIIDMRRERDELRNQVDVWVASCEGLELDKARLIGELDALAKDRDHWRESSRSNLADAERLGEENRKLRESRDAMQTACEDLELEKVRLENELHRMQSAPAAQAPARDWRAELRPCWVQHCGHDWQPAFFHGWRDALKAVCEFPSGIVFTTIYITFADPAKEPQS